jgi:hypothetical protein
MFAMFAEQLSRWNDTSESTPFLRYDCYCSFNRQVLLPVFPFFSMFVARIDNHPAGASATHLCQETYVYHLPPSSR